MQRYHPLTPEHFRQMKRRLDLIEENAKVIERMLGGTYADIDPLVIRAGEMSGSIRRLQWAIVRAEKGGTKRPKSE